MPASSLSSFIHETRTPPAMAESGQQIAPSVSPLRRDSDVQIARVTRAHAAKLMDLCDLHLAGTSPRPHGRDVARNTVLELMEALFEPPLRAWAWIAENRGEPIGYAFATVGFSMRERAYYFNLETLFVATAWRPSDSAARLFDEARQMASELGCVDLRWQVPLGQGSGQIAVPGHAAAVSLVQYVFPTGGVVHV